MFKQFEYVDMSTKERNFIMYAYNDILFLHSEVMRAIWQTLVMNYSIIWQALDRDELLNMCCYQREPPPPYTPYRLEAEGFLFV